MYVNNYLQGTLPWTQTQNVEIVHKKNVFRPCRCDILSSNELNSIKVWKQKDELFYYVAIECVITKYMAFMLSKCLVGSVRRW